MSQKYGNTEIDSIAVLYLKPTKSFKIDSSNIKIKFVSKFLFRFDQIWEPSDKDNASVDITSSNVPAKPNFNQVQAKPSFNQVATKQNFIRCQLNQTLISCQLNQI